MEISLPLLERTQLTYFTCISPSTGPHTIACDSSRNIIVASVYVTVSSFTLCNAYLYLSVMCRVLKFSSKMTDVLGNYLHIQSDESVII